MISEYNNLICPKLVDYIKFFLERVEASADNVKINLVKYSVIDTNNFDINYLIVHGMTGTFTIKVYFEVIRENGKTEFTEDIEIPKMINNIFVIEGTLRVPTNTLDNDNQVTVYDANVRLNDFVNVQYQEDPHESDGYKLTIYIYEDEEPMVIDGTRENFDKYRDKLKLSEFERDKLKVKLDTDDVTEYLRYQDVIALINLGSDRSHDNMIDKKIYSAEANLMTYLWSRDIRKKILTNIKSKFYQFNHIYLKDIQNVINRYFQVASEKNIDFPSTVNPLIFDAMKYKIVIPQNVAYNQTMTDLIDVANTPINGNVNRINELNVCTVVKDDGIYIKCYKYPTQEPVEVLYTHYCTKKVLMNDYWDYDNKSFKSGIKFKKYKLRMKVYKTELDEKIEFDYIEPKADDKLSISTRRIPFGNMSDSVRISMGTSMEKQAVELQNSEPALVTAGHDDDDFELSTLITKFQGSEATVESIKDNKIFIKDDKTGSIQFFEIPSPTPSANDSIISFDAAVKVGDKIKKDSILILPHMFKKKAFELGTNANAIYMNYLGYSHEDGVIISETLADKMIHFSVINVFTKIYPDDIIRYIKKKGSKVQSKDILVNNQTKLRVSQQLKDTYAQGGLLAGMGLNFNQANLTVPNNFDDRCEGYVLDVRVELIPGRELTSDISKETIEDWKKSNPSTDYDFLPQKFKDLHANDVDVDDKIAGYISYKLIRVDRVKLGDKVSNRYGSKGIISLILPDNCMPQIERDGKRTPAEILLNPSSVLHRKNISQLYEVILTKCIEKIYTKVNEFISNDDFDGARKFLTTFKEVYVNKFDKLSDMEWTKLHNEDGKFLYRMSVGFFSKINYEKVSEWMKFLGIEEMDTIYCPDVVIAETEFGLRAFNKDEYVPNPNHSNVKTYELGYLEGQCITGQEYMMKLWKQANYDGKVTSELLEEVEPIMGKGKYRYSGQKIGEMESWVLIGAGIEKFVQDQSDSMKTSQYQFINELLLSGYFIQDTQGNPLLSNQRNKIKALEGLDNQE